MKIAVVGLGLFGKSLAVKLARAGADVIAIDANLELVDDIKDEVALAVKLDATDEKELRAQGVHEVDVLVASIGDDFESNQLLVILAKQFGIKKILARAPSPVHARILKLLGADEVVMPEEEAAAQAARRIVQPSLKGYFELIQGHSVAELEAPQSFHGKTLAELDLKQKYRVNLVAITRPVETNGGRVTVNTVPMGTEIIRRGDILAVAGRDDDIKALLSAPPS
ncbi:MAG: TrkA family potassium uptake protein [Planctomycetes bacterium]|nr:TrkA family potassium uptake protein [Planctomycetota bacterium]